MDGTVVRIHPTRSFRVSRKAVIRIITSIVLLLVILYLTVGAIAANVLTKPDRVPETITPVDYNLPYEDLMIPARGDGLPISAWYIPSDTNQRVIILVHGKDNSRSYGFVDHFVPFANELHKAGFSVMLISLRGHGLSGDARFTFGIKERLDILGAVDWLEALGYQPGKIGALGYSLGAATVVGAAADEEDIGAVWLDSTFADFQTVLNHSWQKASGLPQIFLYPSEWMVRVLYGYDISASRPIDEIGKIEPRPIFMAHCQNDNFIPISEMGRLLTVVESPQSWVIANCDQSTLGGEPIVPEMYNHHALGYNIQPEEYTQRVIDFFDENLK